MSQEREISQWDLYVKFEITAADGKNVKFEGPVALADMKGWFERTGLGILTVFEPNGPVGLRCAFGGPNKIESIKTTRNILNLSLLEGKNFVEGNLVVKIKSTMMAQQLIKELEKIQCKIITCPTSQAPYVEV